jgi:conjugative transposon TraM protein
MENTEKFKRKRKALLVMPVLVIPFLTMIFWAAGGGKGSEKSLAASQDGLNLKLPDPKLKEQKGLDKLSFYDLAEKDSLKLKSERQNDRYGIGSGEDSNKYSLTQLKRLAENSSRQYHQDGLTGGLRYGSDRATARSKVAEENLMKKLQELEVQINKPSDEEPYSRKHTESERSKHSINVSPDVDRLETMMHTMNDSRGDPEIKQLDTVLEKILDLQYPERVKGKLNEYKTEDRDKGALPVKLGNKAPVVSVLGESENERGITPGFFNLGNNAGRDTNMQNAVEAVIDGSQTLVDGSVVKMRLLNDINVNGNVIPADNSVSGFAKLNGERLTIQITSIACGGSIYPVKLSVYDLDGLEGIYVPGSIARYAAKKSAGSAVQTMGYSSLDPSLVAQAATAGVNAAKELFNKKVKLVRVTVKAGYKVFLKIGNN